MSSTVLELVNEEYLRNEVSSRLERKSGIREAEEAQEAAEKALREADISLAQAERELLQAEIAKQFVEFTSVLVGRTTELTLRVLCDLVGSDRGLLILDNLGPELVPIMRNVVQHLPEIIRRKQGERQQAAIETLVDLYLPTDALASVMPELESDNAVARAELFKEVKMYTAEQLAEKAGHKSRNRSATAGRWKHQRAIFSVSQGGREYYPRFQFSGEKPKAIIAKVLEALPSDMSGWQTAFWFTTENSWLDDEKPMDCLRNEEELLAAARHEGETWMG